MEEMAALINNIARFLAFGIGGVSVLVFIWSGFLFMTASGDQQKMGQARSSLMGAFIGLIITGSAFVLPPIVSQVIIEPSGGVSIVTEGNVACDTLLENQLVSQRGANNGPRMNEVIRLIQARQDCAADIWNPRIMTGIHPWNGTAGPLGPNVSTGPHTCFDTAVEATGASALVGGTAVPIGLRQGRSASAEVVKRSFRDNENNIFVLFLDSANAGASRLPSDESICWLYLARLRSWSRGY